MADAGACRIASLPPEGKSLSALNMSSSVLLIVQLAEINFEMAPTLSSPAQNMNWASQCS